MHEHVVPAVDGVVVEGDGVIDQAAVTGEQLPVSAAPGTLLPAGWVLLRGRLVGMSIAVDATSLLVSTAGGLSPVVAAILHNASSVAVVANSSRLIRYRLGVRGHLTTLTGT